jgi:flagellar motor switch protein FliM
MTQDRLADGEVEVERGVPDPASETNEIRTRGLEAMISGAPVGVDRLPTLTSIVERLATLMIVSIGRLTGGSVEVSIDRLRPLRLKDFFESLTPSGMIAIIRAEQWDGYCLAALDANLIGSAVDVLLGGRGERGLQPEHRSCTAIERGIVERLVNDVIARDLSRAFEPVCKVDFALERLENTPANAAITKLSAPGVAFRAGIALEQCAGAVDFLMPYATLDPVRDVLARDIAPKKPGGDAVWHAHLLALLPHTNVTLRAVVERRRISSAQVLSWRPGSKLDLDRRHDEAIDVFCNDLPVLRTRIAEKDGRIALHVEERRIADDWPNAN